MIDRICVVLSVYLILRKEGKVLLSLRQNTGYKDGTYSLISGHVEAHESAKQAMVREAEEEVGVLIQEEDLHFVHVVHRRSDRKNIDIFFECSRWSGAVANIEPLKCGRLAYYSLESMPNNLNSSVENVLELLRSKQLYSEEGWNSVE